MDNQLPEEITMVPVVSSNISKIGFLEKTGALRVQFNVGLPYETIGATKADYDAFMAAKSKGSYFNKVLKANFIWKKVTKEG